MLLSLLLLQAALEIRQLKETITAKDMRVQELIQQVSIEGRSALRVDPHALYPGTFGPEGSRA
jgi:hypothetical protein